MKNKICCCSLCGKEEIYAKGMCKRCYSREYMRKKLGIAEKKDRRTEKTRNIIVDYVLNNKTQSEIAKEHEVSRQWVNQVLKRAGVKKC